MRFSSFVSCAWAFVVSGRKRPRAPSHVTCRRYDDGVSPVGIGYSGKR